MDDNRKVTKSNPLPIERDAVVNGEIQSEKIPSFTFQYKKYTNVADLADALGNDWKNGKRRLYRSLLTKHFAPVNQEIASHCMDAEEAVRHDALREDIEFFCVLYKMYPHLKSFHWLDYHFSSMAELGDAILDGLRKNDKSTINMIHTFILNHLLSQREEIVNFNDPKRAKRIETIETKYLVASRHSDQQIQLQQMYVLGYLYSGSTELVTAQKTFESVQALTNYVKSLMIKDVQKLDYLADMFMVTSKKEPEKRQITPSPQFAAWLFVVAQNDKSEN